MSEKSLSMFASASVTRHLARGALGFTLIAAAFVLAATGAPLALALVLPGMVALRGCPACWLVGLMETVSAGRLRRSCNADADARFESSCQLSRKHRPPSSYASRT